MDSKPGEQGTREGQSLPVQGPLAGIRVIDLTTAWAGPMASRSLSFLGAEVIKIESPFRLDSWRGAFNGGLPDRFPDREVTSRPYNRNALFNTQAHDKLSVGINLKAPEAEVVIQKLVARSDVIIANFPPGVLDRLGLGYEKVEKLNPRIIVVEMPSFGTSSPMANHAGMGKTMEAAAGMGGMMGYGDGPPVLTGPAYLDPIGGLNGAAATLTALRLRELTGHGSYVEVAQTEGASHWIGEYVLAAAEGDDPPPAKGNRVSYAAPHDAYPCSGEDQWIAIAVRTDAEWSALCTVIERPDLTTDRRYRTLPDRWVNQDELYAEISGWTSRREKADASALLQAHGVAAAPVQTGVDVAQDEALRASGFFEALEHSEAGRHEYPGLAFNLSRTPGRMRSAAPCFGEHNDYVLRDLLGLDEATVQMLNETGVVAADPIDPEGL